MNRELLNCFMFRALLAIVGGALYFLGFVGFEIWPLSWVCFVPLLFAFEGASIRRSLFLGWIFGITLTIGGFYWVAYTIHVFALLPWAAGVAGVLLLAIGQGFEFAFFGLLYAWARKRTRWPVYVVAPIAFVVAEFLSPQLFPHYFANSQYKLIPILQMCDVTGVLGLSALMVFVNAVVYLVVCELVQKKKLSIRPIATAVLLLALVISYGYIRIHQVEANENAAPKIKFGMAQINMGIYEKLRYPQKAIRLLQQQTRLLATQAVDVVVWPETAVQQPVLLYGTMYMPESVFDSLHVPILTGIFQTDAIDGSGRIFNSAVLTDAEGKIRGSYRKKKLLMFGEYIPFGDTFPQLYEMMPFITHMTPGDSFESVRFGDYLLGVNICYEDILPRFMAKIMASSPHVLVNITNDNWFGDTHEPMQHLVLAAFRSIEHRRWLVRSTNTGISAFVDAVGRIRDTTGVMESTTRIADVPMMTGRTVYSIFGDWVGFAALIILLKPAFSKKYTRKNKR